MSDDTLCAGQRGSHQSRLEVQERAIVRAPL